MEGFLGAYKSGQEMASKQFEVMKAMKTRELAKQYQLGAPEEKQAVLGQIAQYDPQQAQFLQQQQVAQQAQQAKRREENIKFAQGVKSTIGKADYRQQPAIYKAYLAKAEKQGKDVSDAPEEWGNEASQYLDMIIAMSGEQEENIKYGAIPEGQYLDTRTGQLKTMGGYQKQMAEKPPTGYQWTPQGTLTAIAGGPAVKVSGEVAGKIALVKMGKKDIQGMKDELFTKEGKLDRRKVIALKTELPFTDFAPGRVGKLQDVYSKIYNAIEAKLRLESGQAVPETEVRRSVQRFIPNIQDSAESATNKLDRLEDFLETALQEFEKGRTPQKTQGFSSMSDEQLLGGF